MVADDASIDEVREQLLSVLQPGMRVRRPEQRGEEYERVLSSFQAVLASWSSLCLIAGLFIIYNTTSTGAVRRALSIATLQHVGGDRNVLLLLLLVESLILGVLGAAVGIFAGVGLARLLTTLVTDSVGVIFQIRESVQGIAIDWDQQVAIFALGIGAALIASYFAARRVTRLDPLQVMRSDPSSVAGRPSPAKLLGCWAVLVAVSAVALYVQVKTRSIAWGNFGATLWFAASIIIALPIVHGCSVFLLRWFPEKFGVSGRVAAESLFRGVGRTGIIVSSIALVLTIGIAVSTMALSFRESVNAYFASGFLASDLTVSALSTEGGWLETPISKSVGAEIAAIPGVASVDLLRILPGQGFRGERIAVAGLSDGLFDLQRYPRNWFIEGDPQTARAKLVRGEGARISVSLSDRFDLHPGDPIVLQTPSGTLRLVVADVVPDYMSDRGGIGISIRVLEKWWRDSQVNRISVFVEPGADIAGVRAAIVRQLGSRYRLKVLSLHDLLDYHESMIDRAFAFTDAIQILVVVVTIAGVLDLLLSAILERRREIALWRIIGAGREVIEGAILIESLTIGILGVLLGWLVGAVTAWVWVRINFRYLVGYYLQFHFATHAALWYALLAIVMAASAGYAAAREATRQSVLEGVYAD
ncbi:FtsX-like permease family protein [Candidatus Parcubacteria bacterium]|nr:MAG: FtsX-like permease family protein [Candidatus Parcubacteria bacterium]